MVEKIKALCREQGISVSELERRTGLIGCIWRWDIHKPSIEKVKRVAECLNTTVDALLNG